MEAMQWSDVEKGSWGDGPWQDEPDKAQWLDVATGLPCLAVRHPSGGHWCGYVGVSAGHPWFEKDYNDVDARVHWGLTYADHCVGRVCHVVASGEDDHVWWLGFDCAHAGDLSPNPCRRSFDFEVYRTLDYVKGECVSLAAQAKAAA